MVTKSSLVQPPRLAVWLVCLFTPIGQAESIPGDLLEEFSEIYSKSGVVSARRWYWRQSIKSVAHLTASGFLMAPWLIAVAVVGGWLLMRGFYWLTEKAIIAIHYKYQVYAHIDAYVFWLLYGVLIERLVEPLLVGTIVALAVKGREMVVTMMLGLVTAAMSVAALIHYRQYWSLPNFPWMPLLITTFLSPFMIVIGGGIARKLRSVTSRPPATPNTDYREICLLAD